MGHTRYGANLRLLGRAFPKDEAALSYQPYHRRSFLSSSWTVQPRANHLLLQKADSHVRSVWSLWRLRAENVSWIHIARYCFTVPVKHRGDGFKRARYGSIIDTVCAHTVDLSKALRRRGGCVLWGSSSCRLTQVPRDQAQMGQLRGNNSTISA